MTRKWMLAAAAAVALAGTAATAAVPANVAAALADKSRPAEDVAKDPVRKPGETIALLDVKPGARVADLIVGGGYFTHILAAAVGPNGKVIAYQPDEFIKFQASYGESLKKLAAAHPNVTPIDQPFASLDLPDGLDAVLTVQNYHDLHLTPFPKDTAAKVNAEVFKSLKPGGVYLVVDHVGAPGSGLEAAMKVHRIEPSIVKAEVEAAGFKLESESTILKNEADTHTTSVFDPSLRGKTDQFVMKFRKPK